MTIQSYWQDFCQNHQLEHASYQAWQFGLEADKLLDLVLKGEKTATASAYALYEITDEPLPQVGQYQIILDQAGQPGCVVQTTRLYCCPFKQVSADHAFKEGEGDKTLAYWREVHRAFWTEELADYALAFTEDMVVLCEEFELRT